MLSPFWPRDCPVSSPSSQCPPASGLFPALEQWLCPATLSFPQTHHYSQLGPNLIATCACVVGFRLQPSLEALLPLTLMPTSFTGAAFSLTPFCALLLTGTLDTAQPPVAEMASKQPLPVHSQGHTLGVYHHRGWLHLSSHWMGSFFTPWLVTLLKLAPSLTSILGDSSLSRSSFSWVSWLDHCGIWD